MQLWKQKIASNVGYITKTKGLKGEVQLYFEYDAPVELQLDNVLIELNGKLVPFFVSSFKLQPNNTGNFYFDDIINIEQAQALVHKKVWQPLSKKPERDDEEFSYVDLRGYIVHDEHYGELGEIIGVYEYPQQFIAVVPYKFHEVMFPLNDEIIKDIDDVAGTLHVSLPEGLIDVYMNS